MLASYSWAHSIDTGSYGEYSNGSFANINENKGDSDFDIRNIASVALTYNIPALKTNFFTKAMTDGWSVDNNVQIHSAPPVDLIEGGVYSTFKLTNSLIQVRPDVVPGQPLYVYGPEYPGGKALNPAAFTSPPTDSSGNPLRQGDLGRNALRGFGLTQWDFALHREFPIHEQLKLQFRAEMFNVLNHPNFGEYNIDFNSGDPYFGQATQMLGQSLEGGGAAGIGSFSPLYQLGGPRSIQLALKLIF
jgi:hypothetical protein